MKGCVNVKIITIWSCCWNLQHACSQSVTSHSFSEIIWWSNYRNVPWCVYQDWRFGETRSHCFRLLYFKEDDSSTRITEMPGEPTDRPEYRDYIRIVFYARPIHINLIARMNPHSYACTRPRPRTLAGSIESGGSNSRITGGAGRSARSATIKQERSRSC